MRHVFCMSGLQNGRSPPGFGDPISTVLSICRDSVSSYSSLRSLCWTLAVAMRIHLDIPASCHSGPKAKQGFRVQDFALWGSISDQGGILERILQPILWRAP